MAAAPDPSSDCGGIPRDCDEEARRQHGNLLEMAKQAIAYGHSFLVTGAGGTGKSHFIGDLVRELEANLAHTMACEGSFLVTAMTGVAATVLDEHNGTNSSTFHSAFGITNGEESVAVLGCIPFGTAPSR